MQYFFRPINRLIQLVSLFMGVMLSMSAQTSSPQKLIASMTTDKAVGSSLFFKIKASADAAVKIDLGDGELVPMSTSPFPSYTLKGQEVKIYAEKPSDVSSLMLNLCALTAIEIHEAPGLNHLVLGQNLLSSAALDRLLSTLPEISSTGELLIRNATASNETQTMTQEQVQKAKKKGWITYQYKGNINNKEIYSGEGDSPQQQAAISLKLTNDAFVLVLRCKGSGELLYQIEDGTRKPIDGTNIYDVEGKRVNLYGDFTELVCFASDVEKITIVNAPNLTRLNCSSNWINKENMRALLESLPMGDAATERHAIIIDQSNSDEEHNEIPDDALSIARQKHWKLFDWNGGIEQELRETIPAFEMTTFKQKGDHVLLYMEGENLEIDRGDGTFVPFVVQDTPQEVEIQGATIRLAGELRKVAADNCGITSAKAIQAPHLSHLSLLQNQLSDTAFASLVSSLDRYDEGTARLDAIDKSSQYEQNQISKTTVQQAKEKGWQVMAYDGEKYLPYDGVFIAPKEPKACTFHTEKALGEQILVYAEGPTDVWLEVGNGTLQAIQPGKMNSVRIEGGELTLYGNLTWLALGQCGISSINLESLPLLQSLYLYDNLLTSLDLPSLPALLTLNIAGNQLGLAQTDSIAQALVDRSNDPATMQQPVLYAIDSSINTEKNHMSRKSVELAKSKRWVVKDFCAGKTDEQVDYTGEEEAPHVEYYISMKTQKSVGEKLIMWITTQGADPVILWGNGEKTQIPNDKIVNIEAKDTILTIQGDVTYLDCDENQLTQIELSHAPHLEALYCSHNNIAELSVASMTALEEIACDGNELTRLVIKDCPALYFINASNNHLDQLEIQKCPEVETLNIFQNNLERLELRELGKLKHVDVGDNRIYGENMTHLVTSLHDHPIADKRIIISSTSEDEQNRCDQEQYNIATQKGWEVQAYNGSIYIPYDPTTSCQSILNNSESIEIAQQGDLLKVYSDPNVRLTLYDAAGNILLKAICDRQGHASVRVADIHGACLLSNGKTTIRLFLL